MCHLLEDVTDVIEVEDIDSDATETYVAPEIVSENTTGYYHIDTPEPDASNDTLNNDLKTNDNTTMRPATATKHQQFSVNV